MTINLLPIPVDVPWQRLTASFDMMASGPELEKFPLKWRSSIAMFYFRPEIDTKEYESRRLMYFKVVCSITGYQPRRVELPVDPRGRDAWGAGAWSTMQNFLRTYYPCVGAFAQTAFTSGDRGAYRLWRDASDQPMILNFEPKKREVYEAVTATGEVLSGSSNSLELTKSNSTTRSTESSDTHKANVALVVGIPGVGSLGGGYGYEGTSGRKYSLTESEVRQSDASQERRETTSHTTQLTQLYQQLDSYHLGTNRGLFVLFPRPHILPVQLGDGNDGLEWVRKLEGIQEFFFVVEQPKSAKTLCVSSHLETMHVGKSKETITYEVRDLIDQRGRVDEIEWFYNLNDAPRTRSKNIALPSGFIVDKSRGNGGYDETIVAQGNASASVKVFSNYIRIDLTFYSSAQKSRLPENYPDYTSTAQFTADYVVFGIAEKPRFETEEQSTQRAFVTGRHLHICMDFDPETDKETIRHPYAEIDMTRDSDYVTFEARLPDKYKVVGRPELSHTNALHRSLREFMISTVNDPSRYPSGTHSFVETDFATAALMAGHLHTAAREPDRPLAVPPEVAQDLDDRGRELLAKLSLSELATRPAAELADRLGVPARTVHALRLAQTGIEIRRPAPPEESRSTSAD